MTTDDDHEPLFAHPDEHGRILWLGHELARWPFERHCDDTMPAEDRERIATLLETRGTLEPSRGECWCTICDTCLTEDTRSIPGDAIANTRVLAWSVGLAHYVRHHGLRIDHRLLRERFGVNPDGTPVAGAIVHDGHGA